MADTAALVVALSAQLTKFEKDLQKAGVIAEKSVKDIESKFENLNPQIKASFLGNLFSNAVTAGIEATTKAVTDFYAQFKQLDKQARLTGESIKDLWAFQELGKKSGATIEDALRSLRSMADLINQMKRGQDNSLSQLFDANPQALKGVNRETLTLQQTMEIVANLVRDAKTDLDKVDIARLAGLTEDWVKQLEKGGPAVMTTVAGLKAAAPPLDAMVEKAKEFDEFMKSAAEWAKSAAVKAVEGIGSVIQRIGGLTHQGFWKGDTFAERFDPAMQKPLGTAKGGPTGARTTNVPVTSTGGDESSAWQRTNDQINKNILLMEASTEAVGKNAGEQERLRTIALLKAAADKDGTAITAEMTKQMEAQSTAAANAALTLAVYQSKMKDLNDASKEFGSGLADAFKGLVLEGKKFDEVLKNLANRLAGKAIDQLFNLAFASPAGGGNSMFASLFAGMIPARAGGGSVSAGGAYLVGEHGPELMVPSQSGMVVPNQALGRTGRSLTVAPIYNIDASGADTAAVARLQAALIATNRSLESRALAAVSSHMARGA